MTIKYVPLELVEKMSLYCGAGTSDKVYHIALCRVDGGFINIIYFGKRIDDVDDDDKSRSSLAYTTKPATPTTFEKAKKDFDDKTDEKLKKKRYEFYQTGHVVNTQSSMYSPTGASPSPAATQQEMLIQPPSPPPPIALAGTGYIPQLLNPTTLGGCEAFFTDPDYWASPKADGERFLLGHRGGTVAASNRSGEGTSVAAHLEAALAEVIEATGQTAGLCFDGERISELYYVFDLLEFDGQPLSPRDGDAEYVKLPYFVRVRHLKSIARAYRLWREEKGRTGKAHIRFLPVARLEE